MKKFIISIFILVSAFAKNAHTSQDICLKDKGLVEALEEATHKKCNKIKPKDLLSITHITFFSSDTLKPNTFKGLDNLIVLKILNSTTNGPMRIEKNAFSGLSKLKELIINHANIPRVESYTFEELTNLESLQLLESLQFTSNSTTSSIAPHAFSKLTKLKHLRLRSNKIESIGPEIFVGLVNLKTLFFHFDSLSNIEPQTFEELKKLETLEILNPDRLKSIKANTFNGLTNLKKLSVVFAEALVSISPFAFKGLDNLEDLHLNNNNIGIVHSHSFAGLSKLKNLNLYSSAYLTTIAANSFKDLVNLETLNITSSKIDTISTETFTGLANLKHLDLSDLSHLNSISPHSFKKLVNLEHLCITNTKITKIHPDTFAGLTNLKFLNLSESYNLTSIAPNSFIHLANLKELRITSAKIDTIYSDTFTGLYNLEILELVALFTSEKLASIQPNSFLDLNNLKNLDLSYNEKLTSISSATFRGLVSLEELSLLSSPLSSISANSFEELTNLKKLKINVKNKELFSKIRTAIDSACKSNSNVLIFNLPFEFQDPTSEYFCPTSLIEYISTVWHPNIRSLVYSSYSLLNPSWVRQMEDMIPLIQSSLPQFWNNNNSILNFYFTQMPLFSGDVSELHLVRRLAEQICDSFEKRYCPTRVRIHQYPGSIELQETRELLQLIISEKASTVKIDMFKKMESLLSFLVGSSIDLNFWQKNLPNNFKLILKSLELLPMGKELRLRFYSNIAIKTRLLMEQMDENTIKSHGYFAAKFYTQLVKEVKKNIAEIKVYQNKDKVLLSLIELGHAERLLTQVQVNTLKRLVQRGDSDSMLNKYTTWAIERINFDLGGSAKNPDSWLFDFYNSIIKTSILNEVEKVANSL